MSKLHLVIADKDEAYVESIVKYITNNYYERFQVIYFTKQEYLFNHFVENKTKIDILLLCTEWYTDSLPKEKINTPIILSRGLLEAKIDDWELINKYQKGDSLVSSIINCFAERNPDKYYIVDGKKKAKIISVYSPIGGSGKTAIAVGSSIRAAEKGNTVFYLSLEEIQSTSFFFNCEANLNLSNMLYYIKEKKKNISLKIEGIRCVDSQYSIHYFSPPNSIIDLNESTSEEIQSLIYEIKLLNNYDLVFVDMSSRIDGKNISVLKASDEILLVLSQDYLSIKKIDLFMKELDILSKRNNVDLFEKVSIILNKYIPNRTSKLEGLNFNSKFIEAKIPNIFEPIIIYKDNYRKELKIEYKDAIDELLRKIEQKELIK